ncbi:unnamed protein product [Lupinus luteus]|uniref:Uncharacterized protein n=1 Tax=Lupinus luteus TaxID=3873 RepID=A0AAV1XWY2_LUPLU
MVVDNFQRGGGSAIWGALKGGGSRLQIVVQLKEAAVGVLISHEDVGKMRRLLNREGCLSMVVIPLGVNVEEDEGSTLYPKVKSDIISQHHIFGKVSSLSIVLDLVGGKLEKDDNMSSQNASIKICSITQQVLESGLGPLAIVGGLDEKDLSHSNESHLWMMLVGI